MVELKTTEDLNEFEKTLKEGKKETEVTPAKLPIDEEEEYDEGYDFEEEEEKENLKKNKVKKTDYSEVVETMPELKQDLDYVLILHKIKNNEKLSEKEIEFKKVYEDAKRKEAEFEQLTNQKLLEEETRQKELQEQINKEYEEYKTLHPETIETFDSKSITLKGSDNFLKIALTFMALKKSHSKGGKIFIKVARQKKVSIEWTTKDIRFVEFWSTNERGDKVKEVSRVNQYEYTFEGTPIPVIFAVQGYAESWDFYAEFRKDLSSEIVSGIAMEAYNTGYKDGLVVSDKKKGSGLLSALTEFMPIILIAGLLILGWLMYQMYGDMTHLYNTVLQMQSQMNTLVPTIDANALIYR